MEILLDLNKKSYTASLSAACTTLKWVSCRFSTAFNVMASDIFCIQSSEKEIHTLYKAAEQKKKLRSIARYAIPMTESLCIAVSSSFPEKNPNVINVFQNVSKNVSYFHFLYFFGGNKHICK